MADTDERPGSQTYFMIAPAVLRLMRETAAQVSPDELELGWWRTSPRPGAFGPGDFRTQREIVGPDGVGLLIFGLGLSWGVAYQGPGAQPLASVDVRPDEDSGPSTVSLTPTAPADPASVKATGKAGIPPRPRSSTARTDVLAEAAASSPAAVAATGSTRRPGRSAWPEPPGPIASYPPVAPPAPRQAREQQAETNGSRQHWLGAPLAAEAPATARPGSLLAAVSRPGIPAGVKVVRGALLITMAAVEIIIGVLVPGLAVAVVEAALLLVAIWGAARL